MKLTIYLKLLSSLAILIISIASASFAEAAEVGNDNICHRLSRAFNDLSKDIICGPLAETIILGADKTQGTSPDQRDWIEIRLCAWRFSAVTGYSCAPCTDQVWVSLDTFNDALNKRRWVNSLISHEIGHNFQARELGIWYYFTTVVLTLPSNLIEASTMLDYYEDNASDRGIYGGLKADSH
ncbi:MAG: hypothetical protein JEZ07_10495 [Phycisphaerae bacterium]|nr:hypothetical protein [Phycisphaerae bacterium]